MERLFSLCNPFAPNMERLFSPGARHQNILQSQASRDRFRELNLDVSTEALLSAERGLHTQTCLPCCPTEKRLRG
jgi:hypothetical protein